jgi:uncharacterized protein YegJ (DUF2314 family)
MINDADITDWMFGNDTLVHGAYTTRLILSGVTPERCAEQELGFTHRIED